MVKLNYKTLGQGEPVIILHGLFGMLDNWQTFGKQLADEYQVYLVDQRDHGRSPHTDAYTYPLLAQDIKDFMDEHNIPEARIIGHSMGGRTAMHVALMYPELVSQLLIVDMGVKTYKGGHEQIIDALQSIPVSEVKSRSEVDAMLAAHIPEQGIRLFLMKNLTRSKEGGYTWKINLSLLAQSYPNIMQGIPLDQTSQIDSLFVKGGRSNYILESDKEDIQSIFAKARIETIEDTGHWIHAEKPTELLSLTKRYFSGDL